ncbi:MAG TPA: DinB family protein [Candidatus Limnocylindrales bacterium]|nr:DinB family protein [Candidatus Limnocylindrales bacterium]
MTNRYAWVIDLEPHAPDVVAAWRGIDEGRFISVRREVRRRAGEGSAARTVPQLAALATALTAVVQSLPDAAFTLPGGEGDWNVAEAVGHVATSRAGLVLAASLAASNRWPLDAPVVVPGIPGSPVADRPALVARLEKSQRLIERSARAVEGHELDPCPLEHPLVGRLRCGEWLLFAGVHDLMHLEQIHKIEA